MKPIIYPRLERREFSEDFNYWSNAIGELHRNGEYDITESDLPAELLAAYNTLWTDAASSLCYLTEFKGEYRIALINEFDDYTVESMDTTMEKLFLFMKQKAETLSQREEFKTAQIIVAEESGFLDCHEFIVLLPCDTTPETFNEIAAILEREVYRKETEENL